MNFFKWFLISALVAFFSIPVYAETRANTITFSALVGEEFFSSKRHIENTAYPIVALGYNFTKRWGIETWLGILHTHFSDYSPTNRQINGTLFAVDGVYHFSSPSSVEPFITAGLGIMGLSPNRFDSTNEANFNFGLGALVFANKVVAFRAEARDLYTFIGGKNDLILDAGVTLFLDLC